MSVRSEPYLIVGYRLSNKYKNDSDDNFDRFKNFQFPWCGKNAENTYGVLVDVMGSDYVIAGFCIDCGGEYDGLLANSNLFHDISECRNHIVNAFKLIHDGRRIEYIIIRKYGMQSTYSQYHYNEIGQKIYIDSCQNYEFPNSFAFRWSNPEILI